MKNNPNLIFQKWLFSWKSACVMWMHGIYAYMIIFAKCMAYNLFVGIYAKLRDSKKNRQKRKTFPANKIVRQHFDTTFTYVRIIFASSQIDPYVWVRVFNSIFFRFSSLLFVTVMKCLVCVCTYAFSSNNRSWFSCFGVKALLC